MSRIKTAIVDDHPMITEGLMRILAKYEHIDLVGVCHNAEQLFDLLRQSKVDVLLLDIQLPDQTGDSIVPRLSEEHPQMKIIVITNFDSTLYAVKMSYLGVSGYLLKTAGETAIIEAIDTAYKGGTYYDKKMEEEVKAYPIKSKKILVSKTILTEREKEVLQLITEGYTDQMIADTLFLGLGTIKHYRTTLLLKLEASNTAALVAKALKLGLAY